MFFDKKPNFCTLWVILLCQSVSMETFLRLTFSCYNKTYYSVSKSSSFFSINPKVSIPWDIFLQLHSAASLLPLGVYEKKQDLLLKNPYTSDEKTTFLTFLDFLLTQWLSMANSIRLSFTGSENIQKFVSKNPFQKKSKEGSEKVYSFSRISMQICDFSRFFKKKEFFSGKPIYFS